MDLVSSELHARTLVVAIDPGKVSKRAGDRYRGDRLASRPLGAELESRFPGALRLFAPLETTAARTAPVEN